MTLFRGADGKGVVATFIERVFRKTHIATDNYFYYACEAHPAPEQCSPRPNPTRHLLFTSSCEAHPLNPGPDRHPATRVGRRQPSRAPHVAPQRPSARRAADLYGKYTRKCCPRYLQPEYFERLKASTHRVTVTTGLLHEVAQVRAAVPTFHIRPPPSTPPPPSI
eukprot:127484-Prymnesium_polylepis.1